MSLTDGPTLAAVIIVLAGGIGGYLIRRERGRRVSTFEQNRGELSLERQCEKFYPEYPQERVAELLSCLAKIYGIRATTLRPDDRFDVELRRLSVTPPDTKYEMTCSEFSRRRSSVGKIAAPCPSTVREFVEGILQS